MSHVCQDVLSDFIPRERTSVRKQNLPQLHPRRSFKQDQMMRSDAHACACQCCNYIHCTALQLTSVQACVWAVPF